MSKIGPYELNQIYCGECSEMMTSLPDNSIPFWLTSPPYDSLRTYKGYTFDFEAIARQLYRITQPGGVGVWVVADETKNGSESGTSFRQALYFMGLGFNLHDTMIYEKKGCGGGDTLSRYLSVTEFMFIFSKGIPATINIIRDRRNITAGTSRTTRTDRRVFDKGLSRKPHFVDKFGPRTNIWTYLTGSATSDNFDHPAIFPEALARDHILSWSNPGDLVFDPMAGSGTTLKMAYLTGRLGLGFEISQEYTDLARRRLEATMSQPALFNPYQPAEKAEPTQLTLEASL